MRGLHARFYEEVAVISGAKCRSQPRVRRGGRFAQPQPIFASASSHAAVEACRRKQAVAWLRLQNDEPGRSTDGGSERHSVPFPAGSMDAIFQPQPHGVIADNPLRQWCHYVAGPARGCTIFSRGRDRLRAACRASHAMKGPSVQVTTTRTATSSARV